MPQQGSKRETAEDSDNGYKCETAQGWNYASHSYSATEKTLSLYWYFGTPCKSYRCALSA